MMKELRKKLKKSNKGFSLVELIVVICIMAVLTGIIATAFVKYVGQSKETADQANLDELHKAANTVLADPTLSTLKNANDANASRTLEILNGEGRNNTIDEDANADTSFQELLEAALGKDNNGKTKYPTPKDRSQYYVITITGTQATGYSASVTLEGASATPTPTSK